MTITNDTSWLEKATWRQENKQWLEVSAKVAVRILRAKAKNKLLELGFTPDQVERIVKGQMRLTEQEVERILEAIEAKTKQQDEKH